ncbi:WxL domain-containing protein [Lactococcus garvieae]|uniref:WxL domain-containing protein n=1 Tax=Lactococcus garvieae TaxID=1363 RepID=UPI00254C2EA2|nr:WxL domain-containing protein [Lactococcus garvieae]
MKKIITLSSVVLSTLTLLGAGTASADSVDQNKFNSEGTINFTAAPDTSNPGVVDPENPGGTVDPEIPGVAGTIALDYASNLDFGTHEISEKTATYYASKDEKTSGADFIAMHDLRGEGTWSITVTQLAQFKNESNDLTGAQLSFNKATAVYTGTEAGTSAYMPSASNITNLEVGSPAQVMASNTAGSYGTYAVKYGASADYVGNEIGGPISLSVPAGSAKAGTYTATLEYDLSVVPGIEA